MKIKLVVVVVVVVVVAVVTVVPKRLKKETQDVKGASGG